jgi:heptosyltransferase II
VSASFPGLNQEQPPRRILVRGVNWLGDAVMTIPALLRLREAFPQAHLALLTPDKLADLWQHHPAINQVLTFRSGEGLWSVGRRLRGQGFTAALVLPNSPRSALEVWLGSIPRRVGFARPWRNLFLTEAVPPVPGMVSLRKRSAREIRRRIAAGLPSESYPAASHQLFHYLQLAGVLGASRQPLAPSLVLTAAERGSGATGLFRRVTGEAGPSNLWFGLNPGAEYGAAKRWPADRFIQAANALHGRTGCRWMIFGGAREQSLAEAIRAGVPSAVSLCGQTTLRELMIGLARCRLLLTNDTGPMHLAAAVGTPLVALFGSTSPELTGPGLSGSTDHELLRCPAACAPCFQRECPVDFRCMKGLTAEAVVEAVLRLQARLS